MRIIFCGRTFPAAREALAPLLPKDEMLTVDTTDLLEAGRRADVLVPLMAHISGALIAATSARLIQQWGVGLDRVDVAAATARGIRVCNVPSDATPNGESTAEHALFLMLGVARRLRSCARMFQEGSWGIPRGEALFGSVALIVGFGRIGKALARRLLAMGMRVDAVRRVVEPGEAERHGLRQLGTPNDLIHLAAEADFVVCTAAPDRSGRGLINADVFRAMKPTAVIVNVGRGAIIDEVALMAALTDGTIAGAGLDVFQEEPLPANHPLLEMENVLVTPHVAGVTRQSYEGIAAIVADNVRRLGVGGELRYCINPAPQS
jgi:phosphoglycerate dehydrogenase-like enzyme